MAVQSDPIREWREQYARYCHHIDFEPAANTHFHHVVKPIFAMPRIVRTKLSPGFLFRDEDLVRDGDDGVSFHSPRLSVLHRGRDLQLDAGDATIMQADAPGRCGSRESFVVSEIMIPSAEWEGRGGRPGDALMQLIERTSDGLKLLRGYIRSLERTTLATVEGREIARRHITDLMLLAATPHPSIGESSDSAVVAARLNSVLDHLASHFSDPELSLSKVAQSLQISPRYVQRLLETSGTSFTAHVTELRLNHAFMLLTAQNLSDVRICDVASRAGFSDISHFNRLFRSRFGDTPKGVRANQQTVRYAN